MSSVASRGQFVWHDLLTTDTAAAGAFYPRVAGWKSQPWEKDSSYTLWMNRAAPLGGLMPLPEDASAAPSHWMPYISTPDVAATLEAARSLGAQVRKEPTDIPEVGTFAILADPQGAMFAIFTPSGSPETGGSASPAEGTFSWHELATTDDQAGMSFYIELFDWRPGARHDMGELGYYQLINHRGKDIGGIYNLQPGVTTPHWLSYVRVSDVNKAAKAAKAAGGRVIHGPMEVPGGDWIAQILDPQGAAFAVHQVKQVIEPARKETKAGAASKSAKPARKATKKRVVAKKGASARKRASSRRAARKGRASAVKRASARKTATTRRRSAARKRVVARKGTARRRVRAKKRR
jgi:predicted enzyme related to lactoylglutathione lyase